MTQAAETVTISSFAPAHIAGALRLSAGARWPHRREDWAFMMGLSKGLVALQGGDVVGTGFATLFDAQTAACSLIIVDERMRGQGLGRRLMNALIETAGARETRLVATEDGLALYRSLGFRALDEVCQHQGIVGPLADPGGVRWQGAPDIAHLARLDEAAFGADRGAVMAALCGAGRVAVTDTATPAGGFAIVRPFGRGKVVGPVIAQDVGVAKALIGVALAAHPGEFMRVDVPAATGLGPWLEGLGLPHAGGGIAMVRGALTPSPSASVRTFALVNQALG